MSARPKKIFFIDNDPVLLEIVPVILENENVTVETYADTAVIPHLRVLNPDLILLDVWLTGTAGSDICAEVKNNPDTAHIPVILISAITGLEKVAAECKADAFISKPFDIAHLIHVIRQQLKISSP